MGEETPPVQKSAKQLEKEAKKAAEKAAKLEKLAAKQAKQVRENKIHCKIAHLRVFSISSHHGTLISSVTMGRVASVATPHMLAQVLAIRM